MPHDRQSEGLDRRELLAVLRALRRGDFGVRLTDGLPGIDGEIGETLNGIAEVMQGRINGLERSEALLIGQQEELKLTNERIRENMAQLALASRYKSEFLATMSHELRTPLNSLLILAKMLGDNTSGNLTDKQVEYSQNIYAAGADLLSLISDILDLAKIESGTVTLNVACERTSDLLDFVERAFRQLTRDKGLELCVVAEPGVPPVIHTDARRLQQILKNLVSNAVKFTHAGRVSLRVSMAESGWTPGEGGLDEARGVLAFEVSDTGIGIAGSQHQVIFEAFRQADGSTSRAYGGTGLGLSISRELTNLLGGEIRVESSPGRGSTFTLYLPLADAQEVRADRAPLLVPPREAPGDDRESVKPGDAVVLIADAGARFAPALVELVHACGYKAVVAPRGAELVALARELRPAAISLNLGQLDTSGWSTLGALLRDPETGSIPVSAFSVDALAKRCLHISATGVARQAPDAKALEVGLGVARELGDAPITSVAVVERERKRRGEILASLQAEGATTTVLDRGFEILGALRGSRVDALVVGQVPGGHESAIEWLEEVAEALPPVTPPMILLDAGATAVVLPRMLDSVTELLEETARFLDAAVRSARSDRHEAPPARLAPYVLERRKVLLVDDDIRNIFALASTLEEHGMEVVEAENGKQAIETLQAARDIDIILMDLMMPELDGLDTIRIIRGLEEYRDLPIIAVTAKAMAGDRERSIEAGATDYVAKPVNMGELLGTMERLLPKYTRKTPLRLFPPLSAPRSSSD